MEQVLPKVAFKQDAALDIEVMTFAETYQKLISVEGHNPFAAHKIQFYLIFVVTKHSYSHFVDFKRYEITAGSVLFVAKNQVQYFSEHLSTAEGFVSF